MVLGWLTFEGLVVAGTGLAGVPQDRRDRGVATLARQVLVLVDSPSPPLARRAVSPPSVVAAADRSVGPPTSREALVVAAIELFSRDGPASVSVRDVAELAGVNQGLIYRHFGSKDALLAEAIERASTDLILASRSADGFDFDAVSWLLHHSSPVPRLLARTLADDVDIAAIREEYPVFDRLHAVIERRSTRRADPESFDSRLVVAATAAMALGSALWGEHLRPGLGLSGSAAIEAAVADIARWLAT
jgi:AcrR family transcriptional regulator